MTNINADQNPEFVNSFLDYSLTILNKSPNSVKEYNYDLNMFLKYLKIHFKLTNETDLKKIITKDISIDTIKRVTSEDILSFLSYLALNQNAKAATRARKISTIRIFFSFLSQKVKLIENNPAQNIETPKKEKRMPKYLSLDDSKKLLNVSMDENDENKERDYAIITIFLNCGLRLSELVGINIQDIDFKEYRLTVIGKGNKERTIYLNKACVNAIEAYLQVRPQMGIKQTDNKNSQKALFLSKRRERISNRTVQYIVERELRKAGLDTSKYSTHKLRHTAATLMYQYGKVDIRALQELLGHESIATTEIYTHVNNEQVRNAVESNPLSNM